MPQDQLKPLTALRFIAATWVIMYTWIHELNASVSFGLVDKGYLGVDLFFILSGFILSYVYLEGFGGKTFDYGEFVNHRLARVYPLHIATLAFTLLLIAAAAVKGMQLDENASNWAALPAHLLLVQAWGLAPTASFNHPSWSISAEWFAYLSFPVTAALAWRLRNRPVLAVGLAVAFLAVLYTVFPMVFGFSLNHATFQWGALRIVPTFLFGASLYLAWRAGAVKSPKVASLGAAIAGLTVVLAASFAKSDTLIVIALGLLVLSLAGMGRDEIRPARLRYPVEPGHGLSRRDQFRHLYDLRAVEVGVPEGRQRLAAHGSPAAAVRPGGWPACWPWHRCRCWRTMSSSCPPAAGCAPWGIRRA
ncbi:MAG: acyltransferase [Asticcacaulis sp.]